MTEVGGSCENPETEDVSKMPETYIFNAYFKDGEIASKLTPMTDTVLVLERVIDGATSYSAAFDPCKQVVMRTDKHGKSMSLVSPTKDNLPGVAPKESPALASSALTHSAAPPGDGEVKNYITVLSMLISQLENRVNVISLSSAKHELGLNSVVSYRLH